MKQYTYFHWALFIVCYIDTSHQFIEQNKNDRNAFNFSPDFLDFLKGMDSMVFKSNRNKKVIAPEPKKYSKYDYTHQTVTPLRRDRPFYEELSSNKNARNSEKDLLKDVLMLKLVSYYENKYKLNGDDNRTTNHIKDKSHFLDLFKNSEEVILNERITEATSEAYSPFANKVDQIPVQQPSEPGLDQAEVLII